LISVLQPKRPFAEATTDTQQTTKVPVDRPVAHSLQEHGLKVWYDEFELRIGDCVRRKIDIGTARSCFGIAVLSAPFFGKGWPQYELEGLVTMAVSGKHVLLPLWRRSTR
jgi:hypothetical protein